MNSNNEMPDQLIEETQHEAEGNHNDTLDESAADKLRIVDTTMDTTVEHNLLNSSHEEEQVEDNEGEANVEGTNQDQTETNEDEQDHTITEHPGENIDEQHSIQGDLENEEARKEVEAAQDQHSDEHEGSDKEDEALGGTQEEPANLSAAHMAEIASDPEEELDEDAADQPGTSSASLSAKRPTRRIVIDSDDEEMVDDQLEEEGEQAAQDQHDEEEQKEKGSGDEDEEESAKKAADVSELMQNIFGDDMSDDDEEDGNEEGKRPALSDDEEGPKLLRVEHDEDEEEDMHGRKWDFDLMMAKRKQERRRRRRRDGSIDLMADADDQIKALVDAMNEAASEDRNANIDRRPAVKKRKMLPIVKVTLLKSDLFEAMLDNGMVSAISEWLAPLPDKSLPALEIRCTLLKILERWPNLEQGILKQSGLGRAVMYLFKHPKETKENKLVAAKLIREWSRPIFQLDTDFRSLNKEERTQRDYSQMQLAKRKRLSVDDDGGNPIFNPAKKSQKQDDEEEGKRPGDPGFIPRARVPKPSTKDYVVRPRPEIEGQFRGETKSKQASRFMRTERAFRQKNRAGAAQRAVGVSISGGKHVV